MAVWGAEYPLVTEKADGGVVAAGATGYGSFDWVDKTPVRISAVGASAASVMV